MHARRLASVAPAVSAACLDANGTQTSNASNASDVAYFVVTAVVSTTSEATFNLLFSASLASSLSTTQVTNAQGVALLACAPMEASVGRAVLTAPSPPPPTTPPVQPPTYPLRPPSAPVEAENITALQRSIQLVSNTVTAAVTTSIAASVAASLTTAAAGAAGGAAVGAPGGGGGGGGGSGGGLLPIVFGAQRFSTSSGLGVPPSELQAGVANSLGWVSGEISFLPPPAPPSAEVRRGRRRGGRRRMGHSGGDSGEAAEEHAAAEEEAAAKAAAAKRMPPELVMLVNTLLTCACGLVMTMGIQYMLVLLWRYRINRKYYRYLREEAAQEPAAEKTAEEKRANGNALKTPRFTPWPKSLLWPTPLFFTCCIFVTVRARLFAIASFLPSPLSCLACLASKALRRRPPQLTSRASTS